MFKKLLSDQANMHISHTNTLHSRSNTPSKLCQPNSVRAGNYEINKSPAKKLFDGFAISNQYLTNHLQRKCSSPLRSPIRPPSTMIRRNTCQYPNNQSPLKTHSTFGNPSPYQQNRMPESCYVPSTFMESIQEKQNTKSNIPLFSAIIRDENIKNPQTKRVVKEGISFMSLIKKQCSLGANINKQPQQSFVTDKRIKEKYSIATTNFSSGKKMSFKESLKMKLQKQQAVGSLTHTQITLQREILMLDSVGTISGQDRVNESIAQESFMDLNMDPCFDM